MRVFTLSYLFIFALQLNAQQLSPREYDSIDSVLTKMHVLTDQSKYGKSIAMSKDILAYLEKHPDTFFLSKLYGSLSYSYAELQDKEKAFYYAFKTIALSTAAKDTARIIIDYNDLGVTYRDFDMRDEAKEAFAEAARLAAIFNFDESSIYPAYNLGELLIKVDKKYVEAEAYLLKALNHANNSQIRQNANIYVSIYTALGVVNHKLDKAALSEDYFNKAFTIATQEKYFDALAYYYEQRAELYREDKLYEYAIAMLRKSQVVRDSIEKRKDIALVKSTEAEYKIKESQEKLALVQKEREAQDELLSKSRTYTILLAILSGLLLLAGYWLFQNYKKLKIAKDHAEELSKVKSDFYSEISHELRTPLYAVTELSSLLLKEQVTETHKEYLKSLNFSANHLIALVNNVLELNKVESGKLKFEHLDTNLETLFSNIINSTEYALIQSNNTISLSFDDSIPENLIGDSLKISQVMINLISNAIKFTRDGHIKVIVKKLREAADRVYLYFEVSDNGVGISEENQKKIFDAYYQEKYEPDHSFSGTGIGLSIVNRLLKVMGGQIQIASELGKGSRFYFELPFDLNKEELVPNSTENVQIDRIKGLHFLIVDDNKINQLVTGKILDGLQITSEVTDSGLKAIELVKNKVYNCILMDIHMPGMDGYSTSQKIREFNADIPIIALTAANSDEITEKIKRSDMNACVIKPFFTSDFVETISKVIR